MSLDGKVVVVTGGAGLLGSCFVREIARAGGITVAADANQQGLNEISSNAVIGAGIVETAKLDITNADSIDGLIADLIRRHGRIDAVVNSAYPRNYHYGRKLEDVAYSDFCENIGLHLGGYFLVMQRFCLAFKEQGFGNIVNLSSIYGIMAPRFEIYTGTTMTMPVEYAAIKAGIVHITRYFAKYYKADGIRVNTLSPGGILAAGQPESFLKAYNSHCGRQGMLETDDIVGTLLFMLSDQSRYITGQDIVVDDGFSL